MAIADFEPAGSKFNPAAVPCQPVLRICFFDFQNQNFALVPDYVNRGNRPKFVVFPFITLRLSAPFQPLFAGNSDARFSSFEFRFSNFERFTCAGCPMRRFCA